MIVRIRTRIRTCTHTYTATVSVHSHMPRYLSLSVTPSDGGADISDVSPKEEDRQREKERQDIFGCAPVSARRRQDRILARAARAPASSSRRFQLLLSALTQRCPRALAGLVRKRRACTASSPLGSPGRSKLLRGVASSFFFSFFYFLCCDAFFPSSSVFVSRSSFLALPLMRLIALHTIAIKNQRTPEARHSKLDARTVATVKNLSHFSRIFPSW